MYQISEKTKQKAQQLGVEVKPSTTKNKKIDVYKYGRKLYSIGDSRYNDYHTYLRDFGKSVADNKRRLYRARHSKDRAVMNSRGYYASELLW